MARFDRNTQFIAALTASVAASCEGVRPSLVDDLRDDTTTLQAAEAPIPEAPEPVPDEPELDWLELTSGEWLRGELLKIRGDKVLFDSDKLDEQEIDLEDVKSIRTVGDEAVVTDENQNLRGRLVLTENELWIEGEQRVRLDRDRLFAVLALSGERALEWSGEITLGATARSGNTKQNDASAYAELLRETARTRWRTTYNGVVSRASGVETSNNHRLRSFRDYFLTRRLFVSVPRIELYRDRFQNLDYRGLAGATLGYQFIEPGDHDLSVNLGPAYQFTHFDTVPMNGDRIDRTFAGAAALHYDWDMNDRVELGFDYTIVTPFPETDEFNHNFVARLSVDLMSDLTLDVVFVWDRVNKPVEGEDGITPEADDYRTTIGLGWEF